MLIFKKLKTIAWYLPRPRKYWIVLRVARRKIYAVIAPDRYKWINTPFNEWCKENSIDLDEALSNILNTKPKLSFYEMHKAAIDTAEMIAGNCPAKMGGPGDLNLLYYVAEDLGATRVIETGVAYGWSSLALLLSLKNRSNGYLISTDKPYPGRNNRPYVGCVVPASLSKHWMLIQKSDRQALPKALHMMPEIDMCHYDSDKSYGGRMWAYPRLWKALRKGGIFISDDIGDNPAFHDFCKKIGQKPIIIEFKGLVSFEKYIGILIK